MTHDAVSSVGVHYRYESSVGSKSTDDSNGSIVVQASLYNGTGYNHFTGRENIFRVCPKDDGIFGVTEIAYSRHGSYYSLGNACYLKDKMSATPWLYAEQRVCRSLTLLAGYSHAFAIESVCQDFVGFGAHYQAGKCQLGVFTDYATFGKTNELATELSCKLPLFTSMYIQPTVHLITSDNRLHCVAMLRMSLSL